jgi:hypothetical protein
MAFTDGCAAMGQSPSFLIMLSRALAHVDNSSNSAFASFSKPLAQAELAQQCALYGLICRTIRMGDPHP